MAEIDYKAVDRYLKKIQSESGRPGGEEPPPVCLIFGEELLRNQALQKLLEALLPSSWNYEPVDGAESDVHEAIEKAKTYSLLSGRKAVAYHDARLFDSGVDVGLLIEKARIAHHEQKTDQAAASLLRVLALLQISLEDTLEPNWKSRLPGDVQNTAWLDEVAALIRRRHNSVPQTADAQTRLCKAIENGLPAGNLLIITSDGADRRKRLYKTIAERGLIIDCSVPRGERKVEKQAQEAVVRETLERTLASGGKQLEPGAFEVLYAMTGFDLRVAVNNLEKLIDYVGERALITRSDIETALKRTRKDPVFALPNAVAKRSLEEALFYTASLLSDGDSPLQPEQILVAIVNQVRKLLRIKDFLASPHGGLWHPGCPYGVFKETVLPAVVEFDRSLAEQLQQWQEADEGPAGGSTARRKKTDLSIVKNSKNPYPVYQQFLASDRFSSDELIAAFDHLAAADRRIKSAAEDKKKVLEDLLMRICL